SDHRRGIAYRDGVLRDAAGDDGPSADHRAGADVHAGQDDHAVTEPRVVTHYDVAAGAQGLIPDRHPWYKAVVVGIERASRGDLHPLADADRRLVGTDLAAWLDEGSVTDDDAAVAAGFEDRVAADPDRLAELDHTPRAVLEHQNAIGYERMSARDEPPVTDPCAGRRKSFCIQAGQAYTAEMRPHRPCGQGTRHAAGQTPAGKQHPEPDPHPR